MLLAAIAIAVPLTYADQAKIVSFTVTPRKIHAGQNVTLKWVTTGMRKVSLDWAPAGIPGETGDTGRICRPKARCTMIPETATIYVLTCEGGAGPACASAMVRVETIP